MKNKNRKTINGIAVTAVKWKKRGQHRIYFSTNGRGQGCWDVVNQEWVKMHKEFGARFKNAIKVAWRLEG